MPPADGTPLVLLTSQEEINEASDRAVDSVGRIAESARCWYRGAHAILWKHRAEQLEAVDSRESRVIGVVRALADALAEAQQEIARLQAEIMSRPTWKHVKDAAEARLAQMQGERT